MSIKKIALVGCGLWGQKILRELVTLGADVFVYEHSESHKSRALELGAVDYIFHSPPSKETKNRFDGIIIATPSSTHREVIEPLLALNIPMFIEKPLTDNLVDARAIVATAHAQLFMMHIWQYHPGIRMLAEIAQNKEFGEVLQLKSTRANWTSPRRDVDTLWNFMPHDLSIIQTIFGVLPTPKFVSTERHEGIIRDIVAVIGDEPTCTIHLSNRYDRKIREVRLHCTQGVAILESEQVDHIKLIHGDADSLEKSTRVEQRKFDTTAPLQIELKEFLDYLNGGQQPISALSDGLSIIEFIDGLQKWESQ